MANADAGEMRTARGYASELPAWRKWDTSHFGPLSGLP
jgi:hypothetical protein